MKKKFYLPGLNSRSKKDVDKNDELESVINQINNTTSLLYQFIHTPNDFYRENFDELEKCKRREKRLLEFETPNRAKITHEYDITLDNKLNFANYHYLFNPQNRLSWLKIRQEGKRILIASNNIVKSLVKEKLYKEMETVVSEKEKRDLFFDYIWETQFGYPCFVKLDETNKTNFLLEAEYFDSVKRDEDSNKKGCISKIFSPFDERRISYEYEPLRGYSSWLYVRTPKDFNISINVTDYNKNENQIDFYDTENNNMHSDPEIKTLTIVNKNMNLNPVVKLDIDIVIPPSRKFWFKTIYLTSLAICFVLGLNLINIIWTNIKPLYYTSYTIADLANRIDLKIILAIIAGMITIRGWLISEETIFRRYSNYLTRILIALILFSVLLKIV